MYHLIATSSGLSAMAADGTTSDLSLPTGVTVLPNKTLRSAVLNRFVLLAHAFSQAIWADANNVVYPAHLTSPGKAPTLSAGSGTGYTGTVCARVQFLIKDEFGNVIGASELSPISDAAVIANTKIAYSAIPVSPDARVNARRIYRTATLGTEYFFDFDLDDNTTTTAENAHADASLATDAVSSADYVAAPAALDLVVAYKGRAWGRASNDPDTLYGSQLDDVTSWPIQIPTYPIGAEKSGITGFAARRNDLIIFKRNVILKLSGDAPENFRVDQLVEGQGCIAPDSVLAIRDTVYWLDSNGIYALGPDDQVTCISDETVKPWFTSSTYFNRAKFPDAFAGYDPVAQAYLVYLYAAATTAAPDRWVALDLLTRKFFGPHKTDAFTPVAACFAQDANGNNRLVVAGTDGVTYTPTPGSASDKATTAIALDCLGKFHFGDDPDLTHVWLQPTVFTKVEAGGTLSVTPYVGGLTASAGSAQSHDLTTGRQRLARLGVGRLCRLRFQQSTAGQGCELYEYALPYVTLGRR